MSCCAGLSGLEAGARLSGPPVIRPVLQETALVTASTHGADSDQTLTAFDTMFATGGFTHISFFYQQRLEPRRLREALAGVLHMFPTFSARLVSVKGEPGWMAIRCRNQGVAFSVGASRQDLGALRPSDLGGFWVLPDTSPLYFSVASDQVPLLALDRDIPLARVSVVHMAGGTTAVTVSVNHGAGDLASVKALMVQWSAAYSERTPKLQPVPYSRAALDGIASEQQPPAPAGSSSGNIMVQRPSALVPRLLAHGAYHWFLKGGGLTGMVSYHFTKERLSALKAEAEASLPSTSASPEQQPDKQQMWISTNDALVARLWQALSSLPCRQGRPFAVKTCVDVRRRVGLAEQTLGNFAFMAQPPALNAAACSLGEVALHVRRSILSAADGARAAVARTAGTPPSQLWLEEFLPQEGSMSSVTGCVAVTNWSVGDEDMTFGDAVPVWSLPHTQPAPHCVVIWTPPAAVGGVVASVVLVRKEAKQLVERYPTL